MKLLKTYKYSVAMSSCFKFSEVIVIILSMFNAAIVVELVTVLNM